MSVGPAALIAAQGQASLAPGDEGSAWRAPLVPVALAFTSGILIDRHTSVSLIGSLVASGVMLAAFGAVCFGKSRGLPLVYLALACIGLGSAWHHFRRNTHGADDVGWLVEDGRRIVQLRGVLDEEPMVRNRLRDELLFHYRQGTEATTAVLRVSELRTREGWVSLSGKVQVRCGPLADLHAGDEVEAVGRLEAVSKPENPGEADWGTKLGDEGIRAVLQLQESTEAMTRLGRADITSIPVALARIRGWGNRTLRNHLSSHTSALASALVLGDDSRLSPQDRDRYKQTGVIHVLVVSGQQVLILTGFVLFWLRLLPMRDRTRLVIVVLFVWAYALIAGGRPPVIRAATTFTVILGASIFGRIPLNLNALAAAWILVLLLNPAHVNDLGCQLTFCCVAVLYWFHEREMERKADPDPLDELIDESRPRWLRWLRNLGSVILRSYVLSLLLWVVVTPIIAARSNYLPVVGIAIGPPVILLSSIALIVGFLLLLAASIALPVLSFLAFVLAVALSGCDLFVNLLLSPWHRQGYVVGPPSWWLIGYYLLLSLAVFLPWRLRSWRLAILAGLGWFCLLLLAPLLRQREDELRVTFLSVGHGGCTVLETPDGRTLIYDAGSMRGPDVVRTRIAPYLWSRGIRRIDELFLSHADLDHFNGVRDLLERFPIGQITCTPTFDQKDNDAVRLTLDQIGRWGTPVRIATRGDRLQAGDVQIDVLHPPAVGPDGIENVRSLVLLVRHGRHRLLLTGDLEGVGLEQVMSRPCPVDVLMAPHHGSPRVAVKKLLEQSRPSLVVSCQGQKVDRDTPIGYRVPGVTFLGTWPDGAVTVRSHASGLVVETFVSKQRLVIRSSHREDRLTGKKADR